MLFNKKGIALILLIIVITITSIIGAGIVSFMGAKQKSYPFQIQSYQAYNLAHAGVEFTIRYAYDNKDGFNSNPTTYIPLPTAASGKTVIPFGANNGTFELFYDNDVPNRGTLTSIGKFGASQRRVVLRNFRCYAKLETCP
jgi:hypothetical protein